MISQMYPSELQLNKANTSNAKAVFLDLTIWVYLLDFFGPVFSLIYCWVLIFTLSCYILIYMF